MDTFLDVVRNTSIWDVIIYCLAVVGVSFLMGIGLLEFHDHFVPWWRRKTENAPMFNARRKIREMEIRVEETQNEIRLMNKDNEFLRNHIDNLEPWD